MQLVLSYISKPICAVSKVWFISAARLQCFYIYSLILLCLTCSQCFQCKHLYICCFILSCSVYFGEENLEVKFAQDFIILVKNIYPVLSSFFMLWQCAGICLMRDNCVSYVMLTVLRVNHQESTLRRASDVQNLLTLAGKLHTWTCMTEPVQVNLSKLE